MSLMGMLGGADSTGIFADVAEATGLDERLAEAGMEALYPAIATKLAERCNEDPGLVGRLSTLLSEDSGAADEGVVDGKAILAEIYGSQRSATAALKKAAPDLPATAVSKLAPLSAVAVAASAQQQGSALTLTGARTAAGSGSGGIVETILSALIKSAIQGALRQLTSSLTRRTGSTSRSPSRSKRKTSTRKTSTRKASTSKTKAKSKAKSTSSRSRKKTSSTRSKSSSALEDILGNILGNSRK